MDSFNFIIDWQEFTTDFRGHTITMQLRPLKSWASVLLTPIYIKSTQKKLEKDAQKKTEENEQDKLKSLTVDDFNFGFEVQKVAAKIFPEHVKDIQGIQVNGQPVTIETLCDESVFATLCMDIIAELSARSQLTEAEEKNSDRPSPGPISGEIVQGP